jgi:hypothetical protein
MVHAIIFAALTLLPCALLPLRRWLLAQFIRHPHLGADNDPQATYRIFTTADLVLA